MSLRHALLLLDEDNHGNLSPNLLLSEKLRVRSNSKYPHGGLLEAYRRFWEGSFDRLDDYLRDLQAEETPDDPT